MTPAKKIQHMMIAALISLSGCAGLPTLQGPDPCDKKVAYDRGYKDGRETKHMDSQFVHECPIGVRSEVLMSYQQGFQKGVMPESRPTATSDSEFPKMPSASPTQGGDRAYHCEVRTRSDYFDAFGPTTTEARSKVSNACKAKHSAMDCIAIQCERNI